LIILHFTYIGEPGPGAWWSLVIYCVVITKKLGNWRQQAAEWWGEGLEDCLQALHFLPSFSWRFWEILSLLLLFVLISLFWVWKCSDANKLCCVVELKFLELKLIVSRIINIKKLLMKLHETLILAIYLLICSSFLLLKKLNLQL
jgi:hypothetical protein